MLVTPFPKAGQRNDPVRFAKSQRPQQDSVHNTENGRIRADPQRHHRYSEQREAAVLSQ